MLPFSAGHIADMITRMKNNQDLRKSAKNKRKHIDSVKFLHNQIVEDEISDQEKLVAIRKNVISARNFEFILSISILIVAIVLVGWLMIFIFF